MFPPDDKTIENQNDSLEIEIIDSQNA